MNRVLELQENLERVQSRITNPKVTLIVVTKTYPVSDVEILNSFGVKNFGENRSEEGLEKSAQVPARWHFQGGIQSRKIREILSWADVIHSLDNEEHCRKLALAATRPVEIFLQLSLDGDPSRGGVTAENLSHLGELVMESANLNLAGLMCVPPVAADPRAAFTEVASIHQKFLATFPMAQSLSMGMSGDFEIAVDCGATHIRVGSSILGARAPR